MNKSPHQAPSPRSEHAELIWLLGQPQLADYLDFVAAKVVGGDSIDPAVLVDEWREANDLYYDLERSEAGLADTIECLEPEASLAGQMDDVTVSPWFRRSFDSLPATILKVELDKLVVSQTHVEQGHRFEEASSSGGIDDLGRLFDICLPLSPELPPVQTLRLSENRYRFTSPSTDFRAHGLRLLPPLPAALSQDYGPGHVLVGIGIGFGANFVSAIRSGSRIVLQNGYHRAYALRAMGATHAYCVVEEVTRKDELRLTASARVVADPEFFFAAQRPPLLKDFFNPALAKRLPVYPIRNEVEVELTIRSSRATQRG